MNKQVVDLIRNYIKRLSEKDLDFLRSRFRDRYCGDVGEVVQFLQQNPDIDRWLIQAKNGNELLDKVDTIGQYVEVEFGKVSSSHY